jgi:pimeloyl-ACP methyl ester carboxylesterase
MRLTYRDVPATAPGRPAMVFHDRGVDSVERVIGLAQASGAVGRVVAPFGDYGFTASGMELAGICWYRTVPGYAGADPLSLARAVVQVGDLLDVLDPDGLALIGWGQGAVVALGTGLLHRERVSSVVCVDARPAHLEALPASLLDASAPPPVLSMSTGAEPDMPQGGGDADHGAAAVVGEAGLGAHGIAATGWCWPGGADEERDQAMAEEIGRWLSDG